jgi:hypothetical protein
MSFAALKKQSKTAIENLTKKVESDKNGGYSKDERFWKLDVDKAGNGSAVIRFLPAPEGKKFPYVRRFEYFIKKGNKWYIENCRSTLGEADPMNEYFFEFRGENPTEAQKTAARKYSRSTNYIANIYVVSDPKNPENEGKVFLFKFGAKIFDMLETAIKPEFDDEKPFNPFDLWEGANFKLKARNVNDQRQYDKSAFEAIGPLSDDDEELEKIWNKCHSLQAEIAPDKFKSYDELLKKRDAFLGNSDSDKPESKPARRSRSEDDDEATDAMFGKGRKPGARDSGDDEDQPTRRSSRRAEPEDEEPAPSRTSARRSAPKDEEDEPAPARASKPSASDDDDDLAQYRDMLGDD